MLSEHILKRYGVFLKVRRCQELFHILGFSYKRPRKIAYGALPEAKDDFKKTKQMIAENPDIVLYAMDEAGIKREATVTSCWCCGAPRNSDQKIR